MFSEEMVNNNQPLVNGILLNSSPVAMQNKMQFTK